MAIQLPNPGLGDGQTGDNEFVMWTKVKENFNNGAHAASRHVGLERANVLEYGALGLGEPRYIQDLHTTKHKNGFISGNGDNLPNTKPEFSAISNPLGYGAGFIVNRGTKAFSMHIGFNQVAVVQVEQSTGKIDLVYQCYTTGNTTKDGNGFLKAASPVVDLYDDHIELNHDAKRQGGITYEKLGTGNYLVKGSLGFAQESWYIEMPKDANGNVLVAVVYEQLENNDISIKTYDYMLNKKGRIVPDTETPLDIPEGRCINLRLHEVKEQLNEPIE